MTVLVRLSSKGQLVIPGSVRRALKLSPGAEFRLEVVERKIVLDPVEAVSPIEALYGHFAGQDLLGDLEQEHRREIEMEYAISYADAFAVALADRTGATLVSGDPEFDQLQGRIKLEKLHRTK